MDFFAQLGILGTAYIFMLYGKRIKGKIRLVVLRGGGNLFQEITATVALLYLMRRDVFFFFFLFSQI